MAGFYISTAYFVPEYIKYIEYIDGSMCAVQVQRYSTNHPWKDAVTSGPKVGLGDQRILTSIPYFTSVPGFYECSFMLLYMVWNVLVQSQLADDDSCW